MTLLAIATYDLIGGQKLQYDIMKKKLAGMGLQPYIDKTKGSARVELTHNTFAGKFEGLQKNALKIRIHLQKKIAGVIKSLGLSGAVLVVVGTGWAWGKRDVKRSSPSSPKRRSPGKKRAGTGSRN